MRKLFCLILGGLLLSVGFASCDDEPDNPGDYSIRGSIGITGITSALGNEYEVVVAQEFDSTIVRYNIKKDTTFAADGTVAEITDDTLWYEDGVCHFVRLEQVNLAAAADTIVVSITSNARWTAAQPVATGRRWYTVLTNTGGGDGDFTATVIENTSANARTNVQVQQILTSDSAVIYEIPFGQLGKSN